MGVLNREATALALCLARQYFDGIAVWPSDDDEADAPYWQALKNVRKGLQRAGYAAPYSHTAAVRGLSALRRERGKQEAPA